MHFIYLDESGNTGNNLSDATQPIFVLGALIVPEDKWLKLEGELAAAIDQIFPPPRPDDFEVHASEIINPRGYDTGVEMKKFTWVDSQIPLIEQVRSALEQNFFPVFVSEGTCEEKVDRIRHNDYLNDRDIAINVLFFQVFQHGPDLLLSRAWLIDPGQTQANVTTTTKRAGEKEPWNGEYYVSFGTGASRTWADARKYGFISAGGGRWYSQTLKLLSPGDRVWVKDPGVGYLGVGRVVDPVVSVKAFRVKTASGELPALEVLSTAARLHGHSDDPDKAEHFVRVEWLDTVPETNAVSEVGLFGNQNTVCQPTTPKWRHTVERLKQHFPKWNQGEKP